MLYAGLSLPGGFRVACIGCETCQEVRTEDEDRTGRHAGRSKRLGLNLRKKNEAPESRGWKQKWLNWILPTAAALGLLSFPKYPSLSFAILS